MAGPGGSVRLINDPDKAAAGALYFPRLTARATPALCAFLTGAGACGLVIAPGQPAPGADQYPGLGVLALAHPATGFQALAAAARRRAQGFVAGITGSSGKSSTTEYLAGALQSRYQVHATKYSCNVIHDTASVLADLRGGSQEAAVIEMGFGGDGGIDQMAALAQPHAGIITNVRQAHLDWAQGAWQRVAREKGKLGLHLAHGGVLALNRDDPGGAFIRRQLPDQVHVRTFGSGPDAGVRYADVRVDEQGTAFVLDLFGHRLPCRVQAVGAFQAANAAAAALVAHVAGVDPGAIARRLEQTPPLDRRFQVHRLERGLTVIDDTFNNASADGMLRGLETAAALAGTRRKVALLGAVPGLCQHAFDHHRTVGEYAVACGFFELILFAEGRSAGIREGALQAGLQGQARALARPGRG